MFLSSISSLFISWKKKKNERLLYIYNSLLIRLKMKRCAQGKWHNVLIWTSYSCRFEGKEIWNLVGVEIWLYGIVWILKHWQCSHTCQDKKGGKLGLIRLYMTIHEANQRINYSRTSYLREQEEFCNHHFVQKEYQYLICPQPCIFVTWECQICGWSNWRDKYYRPHTWWNFYFHNFHKRV